jgi:hypothetical protein
MSQRRTVPPSYKLTSALVGRVSFDVAVVVDSIATIAVILSKLLLSSLLWSLPLLVLSSSMVSVLVSLAHQQQQQQQ